MNSTAGRGRCRARLDFATSDPQILEQLGRVTVTDDISAGLDVVDCLVGFRVGDVALLKLTKSAKAMRSENFDGLRPVLDGAVT